MALWYPALFVPCEYKERVRLSRRGLPVHVEAAVWSMHPVPEMLDPSGFASGRLGYGEQQQVPRRPLDDRRVHIQQYRESLFVHACQYWAHQFTQGSVAHPYVPSVPPQQQLTTWEDTP